ncbi:MAG: hypothetical protein NW223_22620 [Hyphomicrobiaceae bacterium]|nr:hypothetical protein [Hyphomicrobiaceae bacterium]
MRDRRVASFDWRKFWPMAAAFLAGAALIGWPWLTGIVTIPWDAKATFLPQIQFLARSLAGGDDPSWLPYAFSGHPQIADPQAMIFSPPFLVLALITSAPSLWAVDATLLAMIALSGLVLIAWFMERGWHWSGGVVAALAFCYGASMAWRIQHIGQVLSLAYLPFALFLLDRALARRSVGYGIGAGLAAGFILLGRDQVALLSIYLLAAYALWRIGQARFPLKAARAALLPGLAGAVACAALIALPILLTALMTAGSNRPSIDYAGAARGSLHPALLLTLVAPNLFGAAGRMADYWGPPSFAWAGTDLFVAQNMGVLYIGALPLILIGLAALRGDLWRGEIRFFTVAAAVMVLYALGKYTPVFRVLYAVVPGVSLYRRPADATFLMGALGAILAGYAVHCLMREEAYAPAREARHLRTLAKVLAGAGGLALLCGIAIDRLALLPVPAALAALFFGASAALLMALRPVLRTRPRQAAMAMAALLAADLAFNNGPSSSTAMPASAYDVLEPRTRSETIAFLKAHQVRNATRRDRIELAGLGFHWPNASITHGLENTLGYNPLRLQLYSRAVGAEDHVGLPDQRKFSALFPSYRSPLANLLGLRFIATGIPVEAMDKTLKEGDLPLVAHTPDGYIYENRQALDRVLFATRAVAADFEAMLREGRWPDVDLTSTVLLPEGAVRPGPEGGTGRVRIVDYRNTRIELEADSDTGGWAVLNDPWHPWWRAELDGKPVPILQANVLFRAVAVPQGRHRIVYSFRPVAGALAQMRAGLRP